MLDIDVYAIMPNYIIKQYILISRYFFRTGVSLYCSVVNSSFTVYSIKKRILGICFLSIPEASRCFTRHNIQMTAVIK